MFNNIAPVDSTCHDELLEYVWLCGSVNDNKQQQMLSLQGRTGRGPTKTLYANLSALISSLYNCYA